jgi:predicted nucleotidyltransferase
MVDSHESLIVRQAGCDVRTVDDTLSGEAASTLREYKRSVQLALPEVEKLILFGSRARGEARPDSDYDVAVLLRDDADVSRVRRTLSDLAYEHVLAGFFVRPIPLPHGFLDTGAQRPTELAEAILRDGAEVT